MKFIYPDDMPIQEAEAYKARAKMKFGESNIRSVEIELIGDSVEIRTELLEGARERIRRLSPEMVQAIGKSA